MFGHNISAKTTGEADYSSTVVITIYSKIPLFESESQSKLIEASLHWSEQLHFAFIIQAH